MKKTLMILIALAFASFAFAQSVIVKDSDENPLLQFNDEGTAGSISLPSVGSEKIGAKLYNNGGNLYWGINQLGFVGSAGGWTRTGTDVHLTTISDNVGIGTTDPSHKLTVEQTNSSGRAGLFLINNATNPDPAIRGYTYGLGSAGSFQINNTSNTHNGVSGVTNGTGNAIEGYALGAGKAGSFTIDNSSNTASSLYATTNGDGAAIEGYTNGGGHAGRFEISNTGANSSSALYASTNAEGRAGEFIIMNTGNTYPAIYAETNGTGPAIEANGTVKMNGFEMPTGASSGRVLTSDGSGVGSWVSPAAAGDGHSLDSSNGSEVDALYVDASGDVGIGTILPNSRLGIHGGDDNGYMRFQDDASGSTYLDGLLVGYLGGDVYFRNLEASDMYFYTNDVSRMAIVANGNVGIGTTDPQRTLHVNDVMRLEPRSSAPSSPSEGDMYMNSTTHKLMVHDGNIWQTCW